MIHRAAGALRTRSDARILTVVVGWITAVLLLDAQGSLTTQRLLGLGTWLVLVALLTAETRLVRVQVGIVVVFASAIEYTFSPLLEVYVYRFSNVPAYVPPGHGLVYLCALAIGRSALLRRWRRPAVAATVVVGGLWSGYGLLLADRPDALGAFWYACLVGFLLWGRRPTLYVGAFLVVSYLELLGTGLGTWQWQTHDPTGLVTIGNPPSGAPGGYGWFDLAATLLSPVLVRRYGRRSRSSTAACTSPLDAKALPPAGPGTPSTEVKVPPASVTTGTSAARSYSSTSGSHATSTAPSATSM